MLRFLKPVIPIMLTIALLIPSDSPTSVIKAETATDTEQVVYRETFASGQGAAMQSGSASLTPVTGKVFDGNEDGAALYVSNRAQDYDAVDFNFTDLSLENGKTYTITVSGYVDADVTVPVDAQAYLQTVDKSYGWLAGANFIAGEAFTLTREFTLDTSTGDTRLRVQSNQIGAAVPFYIGDVRITEKVVSDEEEPPRDPALPFTTITFEDQLTGGFTGRAGTETLTVTNEANHTGGGSYALKVEGRTNTWHGPQLRVEKYVDKGYEYKISAWVKLINPGSSQLQLSTQVGQGGSASYVNLASTTISTSDDWVKLEGTYRYNSVGGEYLTIYVESSNNAEASFYLDDISFESTGLGPVTIQKDLIPIKDVYQNDFLIGAAISAEDLEGIRLELLKMHNNIVTAENAMKPDALAPTKDNFTFEAANAMVDKVLAEGLQVNGHVLVWHQQTPAWFNTVVDEQGSPVLDEQGNTIPLSREEALANMRSYIRTVMENFKNKVISWEVVNEAIIDNPSNPDDWKASLRKTPWYNAIGPDYVEQAFLAAREVLDANPDWNIKLYYNDYNEDNQNKAQAIYNMVKEINDRYAAVNNGKLLIDGIGMQSHYNANTNPENVKLSLEKFISLGVEISITELDIQAGTNSQLTDKQAKAQAYLYAQLFELYKKYADKIKRVTIWGMDDGKSWRSASSPLLFDKDLQAKPAYFAVIDPTSYIAENAPDVANANQSTATFGTPVVDGKVDAIWSEAPAMPINRYQMAWQGASGSARALWDNQNLYVLFQVNDTQLDKQSVNAYEQDSVEIFVDENNAKTSFYQADDGQYRVNFDNETSFNPSSIGEGFESATTVSGTNYTVEVKIPFKSVTPAPGKKIGFDVQVNDGKDGSRQSVATWNDTTGNGWQDTSVYGVLTLDGYADDLGGTSGEPSLSTGSIETNNGVAVIKPEVKTDNGRVKASISDNTLKKALEQAASAANGKKQVIIEVPKQADAQSYEVEFLTQSLQGEETFLLLMKTENATIEIPSNILSNVTEKAEQISIRVAKASTDSLDSAIRDRIGNRPVIDLTVVAGDKVIAWNNPNASVTVTIPYTPTTAELSRPDQIVIWYIDDNGSASAIPNGRYDTATGTVVFETTHFSVFAVANGLKTFGDLQNAPWAKQAIEAMTARDIIKGTAKDRFSPEAFIKRGDFVELLVRALELQGINNNVMMFSDVKQSDYIYKDLAIAKDLGIVTGFGDNTFRPNSYISRQDMMVLTARALAAARKKVEGGETLGAFPDADFVSDYAKESVTALVKSGVVNGKDGKIAPNDPLTRAEAAVILYRVWNISHSQE